MGKKKNVDAWPESQEQQVHMWMPRAHLKRGRGPDMEMKLVVWDSFGSMNHQKGELKQIHFSHSIQAPLHP